MRQSVQSHPWYTIAILLWYDIIDIYGTDRVNTVVVGLWTLIGYYALGI